MDKDSLEKINRKIMRRIRFIYYGRKILQPFFLEMLALFVVIFSIKGMVSLGNVVQNFLSSEDVFLYAETAVLETESAVQIAMAAFIILGSLIGRRIWNNANFFFFNKKTLNI